MRRLAQTVGLTLQLAGLAWLFAQPTAARAQAAWAVFTHSVGEQAQVENGELRGLPHAGKRAYYLELVRALLSQMGEASAAARIEEVPLARGLKLVQNSPQARVVFFNVNRTPEREGSVTWVGPISRETYYFYESTRAPSGIQNQRQARDLPVCVLNASTHAKLLADQGFSQLTRHSSYAGCFRMLAAGRVQLVVSAELSLDQLLREAQLSPDQVRATPVTAEITLGFVALSPGTPAADVERFRVALTRLTQDGQVKLLWDRYAK